MDNISFHKNQIFPLFIFPMFLVLLQLLFIVISMLSIPGLWEAPVVSLQWMSGPADPEDWYSVWLVFQLTCCLCTKTKRHLLIKKKYFLEESSLPYLYPLSVDSYYCFYPFQSFIVAACFILSCFKSILNVWIFSNCGRGFLILVWNANI